MDFYKVPVQQLISKQSNYRWMGSGMLPPGLGFMLHNRGELFSLDPEHVNAFAHGKRPFHTIIPDFVTKDGKPFLSLGVMGGDFQHLTCADITGFGSTYDGYQVIMYDERRNVYFGASESRKDGCAMEY